MEVCPAFSSFIFYYQHSLDQQQERKRNMMRRQRTYDQFREIGKMGMDFDDVITRLLDQTEQQPKGKTK
jgi:hypothetical protein